MALISLQNVSIGFSGPDLLDKVSCQVEAGGRIGLLGRNGAGKSTLLKMLSGDLLPDHGTITLASGVQVAFLQQDARSDMNQTVARVTASGLSDKFREVGSEWKGEQLVKRALSELQLEGDAMFETLSSGMKRRVLFARTIVCRSELLLLDEPTNHLDIEAIGRLESFLASWPGTLIFVTHDRTFLRKLATRILEIDRGRLFDWSCDYDTFLRRKEDALAAQEKQDALFDKRLAQEEVWIRQGIKARRTRNEGRVRALKAMREQRRRRQDPSGVVQMQIQHIQRSGNLVTQAKDVSFAYPDNPVLKDFSTMIMRGDKIGIIGPNGAGKTTLLRILLGKLKSDRGREQNVGQGHSQLNIHGKQKHIIGYLQEFLFTPDRARTQVKFLSGGERNRVLLARLFAKPANVIVLDEPTNDLDTETLEMLEAKLVECDGTILLVSHDRAFLNNVVTSTLVFEGQGLREYDGGYDDWLVQRSASDAAAPSKPDESAKEKPKAEPSPVKKKLSYKEQRELESLPETIHKLEADVSAIHQAMADPSYFQRSGDEFVIDQKNLSETQARLTEAYARWEELESLFPGGSD